MTTATLTRTPTTTGSAIVAALEAAWAAVQERVADLPDVVFITGTGLMGRGAKWGHYRGHGWALRSTCPEGCTEAHEDEGSLVRFHNDGRKPEIFIAGERLAAGAALTLQTILHEGAHALNAVRGENGTSKEGRYHNATFVAAAQELGLVFEGKPDPTIGYSAVTATAETLANYADVVGDLDAAIAVYLDTFAGLTAGPGAAQGGDGVAVAPGRTATPAKNRNNPRALCGCAEPRIIRASRKVLDEGPIICSVCGDAFLPEEEA